jgi:hypothetical protein
MRVGGENSIGDALDGVHNDLNDILFNTDTVEAAVSKLRKLKPKVDDFLREVRALGNMPPPI